jgi:hypothetical protein
MFLSAPMISTAPLPFYDAVLPALGCRRIVEHPGAVGWGKLYPEFWVQTPIDAGLRPPAMARI